MIALPHGAAAIGSAATVGLSLASALIWGTSDFVGGIAARRLPSSAVVTVSHALSLLLLVSVAVAQASPRPDTPSIVYGMLAGITCGTGVMVLYAALALGGMGLTAAVSGVLAAILPVLWAFATEGLPRPRQLIGIVLAAVSIWMIARAPGASTSRRGIILGAVSGINFGLLLILLKLAARNGVLWPLACSRMVSASLAAGVTWFALRRTASLRNREIPPQPPTQLPVRLSWPGWSVMGLVAMAGVFDCTGNSFYMLATRLGRLDIAAVLGSLYPASTILLAAIVLKERTTRGQTAGLLLALVAVILIAA